MTDETIEPSLAESREKLRKQVAVAIHMAAMSAGGSVGEKMPPAYAAADAAIEVIERSLSAAPPSPRSDDGSGLTPSKHGFSAALRAQDGIMERLERIRKAGFMYADDVTSVMLAITTARAAEREECAKIADAEKPVAYMIVGKGARWLQWAPRVADDDADLVTVVPLFASLHREAIAEGSVSRRVITNPPEVS
jgi:hypothetical protein